MKKENMMKMVELYVLSHKPNNDSIEDTEGSVIIKEIIESEINELYEKLENIACKKI